jgi:hypothetical protein
MWKEKKNRSVPEENADFAKIMARQRLRGEANTLSKKHMAISCLM